MSKKQCPMCGEAILDIAKKCPHCQSLLVTPPFRVGIFDGIFAAVALVAAGIALLMLFNYIGAHPKDKSLYLTPFLLLTVSAIINGAISFIIRIYRKSHYEEKWSYLR